MRGIYADEDMQEPCSPHSSEVDTKTAQSCPRNSNETQEQTVNSSSTLSQRSTPTLVGTPLTCIKTPTSREDHVSPKLPSLHVADDDIDGGRQHASHDRLGIGHGDVVELSELRSCLDDLSPRTVEERQCHCQQGASTNQATSSIPIKSFLIQIRHRIWSITTGQNLIGIAMLVMTIFGVVYAYQSLRFARFQSDFEVYRECEDKLVWSTSSCYRVIANPSQARCAT